MEKDNSTLKNVQTQNGFLYLNENIVGHRHIPFLLTWVTSGSPSRKQTTAIARTSSSLAPGFLSWRGKRSVMDVARLSTHTNCTCRRETLAYVGTEEGIMVAVLPEYPGPKK